MRKPTPPFLTTTSCRRECLSARNTTTSSKTQTGNFSRRSVHQPLPGKDVRSHFFTLKKAQQALLGMFTTIIFHIPPFLGMCHPLAGIFGKRLSCF